MSAVRRVICRIDLGAAVAGEQRGQRLIDERSVGRADPKPSGIIEKLTVHGRTESGSVHAMIMPCMCHVGKDAAHADMGATATRQRHRSPEPQTLRAGRVAAREYQQGGGENCEPDPSFAEVLTRNE